MLKISFENFGTEARFIVPEHSTSTGMVIVVYVIYALGDTISRVIHASKIQNPILDNKCMDLTMV